MLVFNMSIQSRVALVSFFARAFVWPLSEDIRRSFVRDGSHFDLDCSKNYNNGSFEGFAILENDPSSNFPNKDYIPLGQNTTICSTIRQKQILLRK